MTITTNRITAAAGLCAAAGGALFIGVQIGHPHLDATSIQTTEVVVRNSLKVLMAILSLAGITGMYLSQVRRNGRLGLIGFVVLAVGYLFVMATAYSAAFVLPMVAATDPAFVTDMIAASTGHSPVGDIGPFAVVVKIQDFAYLIGGLVFGIALFRARVLARWASILLAVGGLVSVLLSVLPDAFYRLLAFPSGIAMIGLGVSLWLGQRKVSAVETDPARSETAIR